MYQDKELILRPIEERDMYGLWELNYKEENPEWKKWDAPYFNLVHIPYERFLERKEKWVNQEDRWVIEVSGKVIGTVSYYWEHKASLWLEVGIGLYDSHYWSGGYGTKALRIWINHLFYTFPLVRVGFTTWSGNQRMIRVGEKLGMTLEARLRKCRYYNGNFYDSIRMGLLRDEWEELSFYHESL
ncbi:Protein N-acetyltransferase, RimJ/RimL family [Salinibacillus kushneri]|uniref:Protein N-acetyltransferase, RimJ/RimL family n=1 Tax=Salinibacillus kushneri TaxID=237682 RepID=A0A1I0DQH8_9BACI|nr:GNAT family protein [Salinibacillus kushneri]SET34665.1 Protein N-acetyltransferase, RimJ/RimL family [Salinibacillus kushneri]